MKPGIYALASLTGKPLDPRELASLGFTRDSLPGELRAELPGFAVRLCDPQSGALALDVSSDRIVAFAGYLDEAETLAASLGMQAAAGPAVLAAETLIRFGAEAADRMLGEWTMLRWEPAARRLTLLCSRARRDTTCFLEENDRIAIAPEAMLLGRLRAGGLRLEPLGVALTLCRAQLRSRLEESTPWSGVSTLQHRTLEVFSGRPSNPARETIRCPPQAPTEPWRGTFEEAVEMLDGVGRRILAQHLSRHPRTAFMLSGGQDSTLLAAWGGLAQGDARAPVAISSVAPPGSGLPDESAFSRAAAEALGLEWKPVWPADWTDPRGNLFRPDAELFQFYESPVVGNRAPLYQALREATLAAGATAQIDGALGEATVTGGLNLPATASWDSFLDVLRTWKHRDRRSKTWPADAFHVNLSPELLAQIPREWETDWRNGMRLPVSGIDRSGWTRQTGRIGIGFDVEKTALTPTAEPGGVRRLFPFRDRRLIAAAAGLPAGFQLHGGVTRALSRALLKGRVPEMVRLRTVKQPFSPDFETRLRGQAPAALARVALYREAVLGSWLDLAELQGKLERLVREPKLAYGFLYATQQTVITAEFLLWAREQGATDPL